MRVCAYMHVQAHNAARATDLNDMIRASREFMVAEVGSDMLAAAATRAARKSRAGSR